ncbi:MAG: phosphatidylglycerophosphatase A [Desulfobacter sp.]|nr:phosphatidylglycerophosphatase A [Desulfobacter sp.]
MALNRRVILFLATGFGLGKMPVAPGTFGTLAGLPFIFLMDNLGSWSGQGGQCFFLVCFFLVSIVLADWAEKILGLDDPGCIVVDEMVGYCIAVCLVPITPMTLLAGFAAFRCFDILKPMPVRYFEKNFSGGAGVVLDDIMAGVLAAPLVKMVYLSGVL